MTTALAIVGVLVLLTGIPVFLPRRDRTADPEDPGAAFVVAMLGIVVGLLIVVGGIIYLGELSGDDALVSDNVRDARRYATIGIVLGGVITVLSAGWLLTERIRPPRDNATADTRIPCPQCAEPIQPAAQVCRYCGHVLDS